MKFRKALFAAGCPFIFFSCFGQTGNQAASADTIQLPIIRQLKGKSLQEAKMMLQEQSEELEQLFRLFTMKLEISPIDDADNTSNDGVIHHPLYTLIAPEQVESGMAKVAQGYTLNQYINNSRSYVQAYMDDQFEQPDFYKGTIGYESNKTLLNTRVHIRKLFFHDKSEWENNSPQDSADSDDVIDVPGNKPIDSALAQLQYSYITRVEKVVLDAQQPKQTIDSAFFELKTLGSNDASILISGKDDYLLAVAGVDAGGRLIGYNSSSSSSLPSAAKQQVLQNFNQQLKTWVKNIDTKKYKGTDDLIADISHNLPQNIYADEMQEKNIRLSSYHFYHHIEKLVIYYATGIKEVSATVVVKNQAVIATGFSLAEGDKEDYRGIVGADGNWIIPPDYKGLHSINSYYYSSCTGEGDETRCQYFRFDESGKKLIPVNQTPLKDYLVGTRINNELIRYYKIVKRPDGSEDEFCGVLDKAGRTVLNPQFYEITLVGNYFVVTEENPGSGYLEFGLYSLDGTSLLPENRDDILGDNGFIFISTKEEPGSTEPRRYVLLDEDTGKPFLPNGIYALQGMWSEGMLLVTDGKQHYFIDREKHKKVDVTSYADVGYFDKGYIWVRNGEELTGLLNKEGKLVLPCVYKTLSDINNNICLAVQVTEAGQKTGLIDVSTGKPLFPFLLSDGGYSTSGKDTGIIYQFGGKKFDAFGKEISD